MAIVDEVAALLNSDAVTPAPRPVRSDGLQGARDELAGYVQTMGELSTMPPDQVLGWLSSISARVLEMMYETLRHDGRAFTKFRVEELIPLREELRFQYEIASRRHTMEQFEFKVAGGQYT